MNPAAALLASPAPGLLRTGLSSVPCKDAVTGEEFRSGMRALPGAVCIVTAMNGGRRVGLTVSAVCSLSASPPRLLVCVNNAGTTFSAITASRTLAVNVLAADQAEIARDFAGMSASGADRFQIGAWVAGKVDGMPVLEGAVVGFECRVAQILDAVTHGIVICDVVGISAARGATPLLYCAGQFGGMTIATEPAHQNGLAAAKPAA